MDRLIGDGIVRGRISEIIGNPGTGKTSLAAAFTASVTARGEVAAWIDAGGGFDPASIATAGVDLARMLWVAMPTNRNRLGHKMVNEVEESAIAPSGHARSISLRILSMIGPKIRSSIWSAIRQLILPVIPPVVMRNVLPA